MQTKKKANWQIHKQVLTCQSRLIKASTTTCTYSLQGLERLQTWKNHSYRYTAPRIPSNRVLSQNTFPVCTLIPLRTLHCLGVLHNADRNLITKLESLGDVQYSTSRYLKWIFANTPRCVLRSLQSGAFFVGVDSFTALFSGYRWFRRQNRRCWWRFLGHRLQIDAAWGTRGVEGVLIQPWLQSQQLVLLLLPYVYFERIFQYWHEYMFV